jgi:hypothetical protein
MAAWRPPCRAGPDQGLVPPNFDPETWLTAALSFTQMSSIGHSLPRPARLRMRIQKVDFGGLPWAAGNANLQAPHWTEIDRNNHKCADSNVHTLDQGEKT